MAATEEGRGVLAAFPVLLVRQGGHSSCLLRAIDMTCVAELIMLVVVMMVMVVFSLAVLAVVAGAQRGTGHASLETLAIVLLAARLSAIAPLKVMLSLFSISDGHELLLIVAEISSGSGAEAMGD